MHVSIATYPSALQIGRCTSISRTSISRIFDKSEGFFGNGYISGGFDSNMLESGIDKRTFFVGNPSERRYVKLPLHITQRILGHCQGHYRLMMPLQRNLNPKKYQKYVVLLRGKTLKRMGVHKHVRWERIESRSRWYQAYTLCFEQHT